MNKVRFKKLHSQAKNMSDLARLLKCTRPTAYRWCEVLKMPLKIGTPGRPSVYDPQQIKELWKSMNGNVAEIARAIGCSYLTALRRVKLLGLKPKGKGGATVATRVYRDFKHLITVNDLVVKYGLDSRTVTQMILREYERRPIENGYVKNVREVKIAKVIESDPSIAEGSMTEAVKRIRELTRIQRPWIIRYWKKRWGTDEHA